jgi:hypothetical protein
MRQLIAVYMAFTAMLVGALACSVYGQVQAKKPPEKTQAKANSTESQAPAPHKLSKPELGCIVRMLGASTLAQAKARKAACKDSFVLRASYASLLVRLHAPGADEEIVRNMPQVLAELDAFYGVSDAYLGEGDAERSRALMLVRAYERYYKSLFRIVAKRPSLLPKFFPIAARFGTGLGGNVDETGWFCNALHDIEVKIPAAYWRAVRQTKNKVYRGTARGCALHPVP